MMTDPPKVAFFVWTGSIFASQAMVVSTSIYYKRIGGIPELLYFITCILSGIPFTLCFIAKSRGLPWSFEWGICFPLACIHSLGIYAVAWFPIAALQESERFRHGVRYLTICLAFALLTFLLTLLGAVVHRSCRAVRLRWRQRPERPAVNVELRVLCLRSAPTSDDHNTLGPLPSNALCFISQLPTPFRSFDEEARELLTLHTPSPTYPQTNAWPSRNRLDLTIRADAATPNLILNPFDTRPSGIGHPERGRDTGMKSLGGSIKGEADRRFIAESSPKKHVRIGRGRDLA